MAHHSIARLIADTLAGLSDDMSALDALMHGHHAVISLDLDPALPIEINPIALDLTSQVENIDRISQWARTQWDR